MNCKQKTNCICCDSTDLKLVLDLHEQPLANSYHTKEEVLESFPLGLNLCRKCFHLQLSHIVDPDLLFKHYLYVSGTTKTLKDYFKWFASYTMNRSMQDRGHQREVLDIACNDGTQLDFYKSSGWGTYGVDPAENLYKDSSKNHTVLCEYFSEDSFKGRRFDVILAQNVFAHNENALQFLNDCSTKMRDHSKLYVQTSQAELVKNNQFDTIYHEHLSFFNINSMKALADRSKLSLTNVIKVPVHGISYVFEFSKKYLENEDIGGYIDGSLHTDNALAVENEYGLTKESTYDTYAENVQGIVQDFKDAIEEAQHKGFKIIGYGAAAKGMTFLNFAREKMDFIIDDNELKHNLLTPGQNTEIVPVTHLEKYGNEDKILFVPLAWNFYTEIVARIKAVRDNPNDRYIKYFPSVSLSKE
tara:strand:- start:212 stop:1456 length:1245 start_codon:yes stop_codon:yes gene_type:complete